MRVIESLETTELSKFDRMIPKGGLLILPGVLYVDVNDISPDERRASKQMFYNDEEYRPSYLRRNEIWKGGNDVGRRYCVYTYKDGSYVGNVVYTEKLDNPHGYGKNDFAIAKWSCKPYRHTKYARYMSGDLNHILFMSGIANRIYSYPKLADNDPGNGLWARLDLTAPCMGKIYSTDGPLVQKYISIKREFQTDSGRYAIMELDGNIYRKMDLVEYLLSANATKVRAIVEEMLVCMNHAAETVKHTVGGIING